MKQISELSLTTGRISGDSIARVDGRSSPLAPLPPDLEPWPVAEGYDVLTEHLRASEPGHKCLKCSDDLIFEKEKETAVKICAEQREQRTRRGRASAVSQPKDLDQTALTRSHLYPYPADAPREEEFYALYNANFMYFSTAAAHQEPEASQPSTVIELTRNATIRGENVPSSTRKEIRRRRQWDCWSKRAKGLGFVGACLVIMSFILAFGFAFIQ